MDADVLGEEFVRGLDRVGGDALLLHGEELLAGRHDIGDQLGAVAVLDDVAREQADEFAVFIGDREGAEIEAALVDHLQDVADGGAGQHGHRVGNEAVDVMLHAGDLADLVLARQVVMDEAQAAVEGHGDGHARLGDGVHVGGQDRDLQAQAFREGSGQFGIPGEDLRMERGERHVVVRQRIGQIGGKEAIGRQVKVRIAGRFGNRLRHRCRERNTPAARKLKRNFGRKVFDHGLHRLVTDRTDETEWCLYRARSVRIREIRGQKTLRIWFIPCMRGFPMTYRFLHRHYRLPLRTPLRTAHGSWAEREGILVRLESEAGLASFGEIAPIPWFGTETMAEADEICRKLGDRISDTALDQVPKKMGAVRFALAAALGRPGAILGAPRVPVTALLPAGRAALAALPARLEAGSLSFKWKVGVESADLELGLLDELLDVLPTYAKLRLDANGAWDRRVAERWLTRCADRPVEFVEQPVAPEEEELLHGLAENYPVKLALDESVTGLDEARRWQAEGWSGVFVLKPALAGPLEEVAAWVVATGADVVLSSAIETALGRAAIFRFALQHHTALLQRSPGFGIGEVFGDRLWDGPLLGSVLDEGWTKAVNPEALWNALS